MLLYFDVPNRSLQHRHRRLDSKEGQRFKITSFLRKEKLKTCNTGADDLNTQTVEREAIDAYPQSIKKHL